MRIYPFALAILTTALCGPPTTHRPTLAPRSGHQSSPVNRNAVQFIPNPGQPSSTRSTSSSSGPTTSNSPTAGRNQPSPARNNAVQFIPNQGQPSFSRSTTSISIPSPTETPQEQTSQTTAKEKDKWHCKVVINEVMPYQRMNTTQFIELRRVCDKGHHQPSSKLLNGHIVLTVDIRTATVTGYANLNGEQLEEVAETVEGISVANQYYVFGTSGTANVKLTFGPTNKRKIMFEAYPSFVNAIPRESAEPKAVILLYFPLIYRNESSRLKLPIHKKRNDEWFQVIQLDDKLKLFVQDFMIDIVTYGEEFEDVHEEVAAQLVYPSGYKLGRKLLTAAETDNEFSYSRCTEESKYMDAKNFQYVQPTPGKGNQCKLQIDLVYPYKLKGMSLQHTAKYLVANVLNTVQTVGGHLDFYRGRPAKVAASLLGLAEKTVNSIRKEMGTDNLVTPGRIRKLPFPVMDNIDEFDRSYIRRRVAEFYRDNRAPYFDDIYEEFLTYKRGHSTNGTVVQTNNSTNDPTDKFCGKNTFRKVLKQLGFAYGRIDTRLAIIQRPDLVEKRGKFRDNLKRSNPLNVTYLDETWIDPFQRSPKGWIMKKPKTFKEGAEYTYNKAKIGRGPRLIVLSAATYDGVIKESVEVYKISKANVSEDYHSNINKETFMAWFMKLMDVLEARGERHLFVMDNAPYHSSLITPKSTAKKQELYDWVNLHKNVTGSPIATLPVYGQVRRWQLWQWVQQFKELPAMRNELYEVDRIAAARGHEVARLAAYHCHLNPIEQLWSDVKRVVARENRKQTLDDVQRLAERELRGYNVTYWQRHVAHTTKLMEQHWIEDGWFDNDIQSFIIPLDDDDDDMDVDVDEHPCNNEVIEDDEVAQEFEEAREEVLTFHANQGPPPKVRRKAARRLTYVCNP